ncbi:MAG: hypothetical protein ACJARG_002130 [Arcticibacterium sp.]|jgi:hypothetical protein
MKKILFVPFCLILLGSNAQKFRGLDKSPLDMSYYPYYAAHDLPFVKTADDKAAKMTKIKIVYSRPAAKGREIFGGLVKYGKPWRLGANETTEVTFYAPVRIGDEMLFPGTYAMYITPEKDSWTLTFHPTINGWGVYNFDFSKDLAHLIAIPTKSGETIENLSIVMYKAESGNVHIKIGWGDSVAEFPITLL